MTIKNVAVFCGKNRRNIQISLFELALGNNGSLISTEKNSQAMIARVVAFICESVLEVSSLWLSRFCWYNNHFEYLNFLILA
jgi:hypothetical protein